MKEEEYKGLKAWRNTELKRNSFSWHPVSKKAKKTDEN